MLHIFVTKLKKISMKLFKESIVFTLEMLKFILVSVPIFLTIYFAINLFYELKHLTQWKTK